MIEGENKFNINTVLKSVFSNIAEKKGKRDAELIFEMEATVPKELRGDAKQLVDFLTRLLLFVIENSSDKEIVLSLSAPEDFIYEEEISFEVKDSSDVRAKTALFLEESLGKELKKLQGKIVTKDTENVKVEIPFRIHELGFRRHYRLSDRSFQNKKVLIVCESKKLVKSIKKMFEYFHYKVDTNGENDLKSYDILVTEDKVLTDAFKTKILEAKKSGLKCVWIGKTNLIKDNNIISTHLSKPITQESIWKLIETLFNYQVIQRINKTVIQEDYFDDRELVTMIEQEERKIVAILDTETGEKNCREAGVQYKNELKKFLEVFDRSDIYLRDLTQQHKYEKIEQFCGRIADHARLIGALSLLKVVKMLRLVLLHQHYDLLAIYPRKYHAEFTKLKEKIEHFVKG
ncbi:MAG: hypothetical protein ABXS92_02115 [Sulfurimonas sp.]